MRLEMPENLRMALSALHSHKLRSFLALLGIIIGVATVIAVSSVIAGLGEDVAAYIKDYGTNTLWIFRFDPGIHIGRLSREERTRKPLTLEDAEAIRESCPAVKNVVAEVMHRIGGGPPHSSMARYRDHEVYMITYTGSFPAYVEVFNANLAQGRFFTEAEVHHRVPVAVIGYHLAEAFFPNEDPMRKTILVDGRLYEVVGVLERTKGEFFRDEAGDRRIVVPYWTFRKDNPGADEHLIAAEAYPGKLEQATDEVRGLLRRRRGVGYNEPDNFGISHAQKMVEEFHQLTGAIALALVVVSSIGLLVGGVGVMAIMLVSVTERTREIGVRKAIGARRRDIVWQFLMEAMTLTGVGGVLGIALGYLVSVGVDKAFPRLPTTVPTWAVAAGVIVSVSVGLFFGMYPAVKAARLDPVDALRYE